MMRCNKFPAADSPACGFARKSPLCYTYVMKSHISATIDRDLVTALQEIRKRERRSLSNVLEAAVAEYLDKRQATDRIVTSAGSFAGSFSRRDTYAKAQR